jgi:hypothetical protein
MSRGKRRGDTRDAAVRHRVRVRVRVRVVVIVFARALIVHGACLKLGVSIGLLRLGAHLYMFLLHMIKVASSGILKK